jgi:hypothetical protein
MNAWSVCSIIVLGAISHLAVAASVQEKEMNVLMTGQQVVGRDRIYVGQLAPVTGATLVGIRVPRVLDPADFHVLFMKPGFTQEEFCRNDDAVVVVSQQLPPGGTRTGSMSSEQMQTLLGAERVPMTQPIQFVACTWSLTYPYITIEHFHLVIKYEEETEADASDAVPATKEERFRGDAYGRIYSVFCQQLSHNRGCQTSFACPSGYVMTHARAACNLETGEKAPLPESFGTLSVERASDRQQDGQCAVGDVVRQRAGSYELGISSRFKDRSASNLSCKEHDRNGGDCSINAEFICEQVDPLWKSYVDFGCSRSGDNGGCRVTPSCPTGYVGLDVRASCNLETTAKPPLLDFGVLTVTRPSDNPSSGKCWFGDTTVSTGSKPLWVVGQQRNPWSRSAGCSEHDENGGDCHLNGQLVCQRLMRFPLVEPGPPPPPGLRGR